ncbi:MAG: LytTR family DNA-binding domain-containing protein [Bacteroidia bacterium]
MIKAIALDDEPPALKVIETYCEMTEGISLVRTFTRPSEAERYITRYPVDLIFLDINMPTANGIEFYKGLDRKLMVIFTTAHAEFAVEGFNINALDYLLKPIRRERFDQAVQKAKEQFELQQKSTDPSEAFLLIRADYSLHRIKVDDILYIEGLDDYLKIHIADQKTVVTRMTMKNMLHELAHAEFVRVHKSFIVPMKRVNKVRNRIIYIGEHEIPIGNSYEEEFMKLLSKY